MTVKVLFVCLGNICRSPTAHGVFQHYVEQAGHSDWISIDSAGTGAWHVGKAPDSRATAAASSRGYDLSPLRARQVHVDDFDYFDYILAMDCDNLNDLAAMRPGHFKGELGLFLNYGDDLPDREVPDPYYGGDEGFEAVLDMIEAASDGLLQHLLIQHRS